MEPLKKRLLTYIIIIPIALFLVWLNRRDLDEVLFVGVILMTLLLISAAWEYFAMKRREAREHDDTVAERTEERYQRFLEKKGFERVRRKSMKADLKDRYRSIIGYILLPLSIALLAACIFIDDDDLDGRLAGLVCAVLFGAYALWKCTIPQVRTFCQNYAEYIPAINESYLNGKMLTFRRGRDPSENSGINIGEDFVVFYDKSHIYAARRSEILSASFRDENMDFYGTGMYTGSRKCHYLDMHIEEDTQPVRTLELGEFQNRIAAEELNRPSAKQVNQINQ